MTLFVSFFSIFFASHLLAISMEITRHNPVLHNSSSYFLKQNPEPISIENIHLSQLKQKEFQSDLAFFTRKIRIGSQEIVRSTPIINNLPTEGADGILNKDAQGTTAFAYTHFTSPKGKFVLNAAEAMEVALLAQTKSTFQNPYIEKTDGIYEAVWLMHFGELRPAFKTRLPTLSVFDLKDIYIDAENGEILKIDDSAYFATAPANTFIYSANTQGPFEDNLRQVVLKDLVEVKKDGFLQGEYINVRTCCKYFTCPSGKKCTPETMRCALKSHPNAQQRRETVSLPSASLGLDPLLTLPKTVSVDAVRCTYLPFARASVIEGRGLGFYETPVDGPSIESEMDRFSEIQAYFSMSSFFKNIRELLNDDTWCLREQAMSCNTDGSPTVDTFGMPVNPYKVFVNQMIPDMKVDGPSSSDPESFIVQILAGHGSKEKPVVINDFTRIGNAAFIPSLNTLKANTPRADEILSDLIKPFDHNVFFQGDRDFAYDGHVVFHEFMHAITTSMVGKLNSLGLSPWGINSEPGSLNEGWSDYFAAAFTNDPQIGEYAAIEGGYGEVSLRTVDNQKTCPKDVSGEVHNDAQIWSGALWELRSGFEKRGGASHSLEFDRSVLAALAQSTVSEDFKSQSKKLIEAVRQNPLLGEKGALYTDAVLEKRGLKNCFRATTLSVVDKKNNLKTKEKDLLFVPSRNQIGLKNFAPSSSQLEIGIPAGAKKMEITWRQYLGGTGALLGTETTPDSTSNIEPLGIVSNLDSPIKWKFNNAVATPTRQSGEIEHDGQRAFYKNGLWHATSEIDFDPCEQRTAYVSLLSYDFKYMLKDINVSFEMDKRSTVKDCDFAGTIRKSGFGPKEPGCSTRQNNGNFIMLMLSLLVFFGIKSRRKRSII